MARPRRTNRRRGRGKGTILLRFEVKPSPDEIARRFGHLSKEFKDYRPAWKRLAPRIAREVRRIFSSKGGLLGERWPPHVKPKDKPESVSYIHRKQKAGFGRAEMLVRTGRMMHMATSPTRGLLANRPSFMRFGVKGPQVRAMNFGSLRSKKNIPKRPFIGVTKGMEIAGVEEIGRHVDFLLKKAFALGAGSAAGYR